MPNETKAELENQMSNDSRFRLAKIRKWTDEEAKEVAALVRKKRPDVWEKLVEIERTTGDYNDVPETIIEWRLMCKIHPECELSELTRLFVKLRQIRVKIISGEEV